MRSVFSFTAIGVAAILLLSSGPLFAQGAVVNGDFETGSYTPMWTLTGGNLYTELVVWASVPGVNSYCLKRRPGTPSSNGGLQETVALVGGVTYLFSADVASQYCSS